MNGEIAHAVYYKDKKPMHACMMQCIAKLNLSTREKKEDDGTASYNRHHFKLSVILTLQCNVKIRN